MWNWILRFFTTNPAVYEMPSPKIRIQDGDIFIFDTGELTVKGFKPNTIARTVADTNSMEPMIDAGMMVILEPVTDVFDLIVGDVILYHIPGAPNPILHRIIKIDTDGINWWCHTQGDRNPYKDPGWIEASWVQYVFRGVIT